jgi:phage tail sheath protein FI
MPEYLAPGVYVEEVSFRSKSIEGVPTSTTGFAGLTAYGPVHYAVENGGVVVLEGPRPTPPRLITSFTEFEAVYGGLQSLVWQDGTERLGYVAHAARAFFLNGGKRLYVSRVFVARAGDVHGGVASRTFAVGGGSATWRARWPGAAGNVRVTVELLRSKNIAFVDSSGRVQASRARTGAVVEVFPPGAAVTPPPPPDPARLHVVEWNAATQLMEFHRGGAAQLIAPQSRIELLEVRVRVQVSSERVDVYDQLGLDPRQTRWIGKILQRDDPEDENAVLWLDHAPGPATPEALLFGLLDSSGRLDHGNDGVVATANDLLGREADPDRADRPAKGLEALGEIEDIAIVALPDSGALVDADERESAVRHLLSHAERQKYRIAIVDGPANSSISEIRAYRGLFDSKYGALYHPWIEILDPTQRAAQGAPPRKIKLPPSGFVAGIYARSDIERGVHKAPANEIVTGLTRFEANITKPRQDVLNPEGINALRAFEGRGSRVWGARTISSDPEWKYVNVRRLFIYLEHSIDKGTQWAVFEPNNEALWNNLVQTVSDFLYTLWRDGALLGEKPEDAYFVRCDRTTMSQNDIDTGRCIVLVGVAPTKPAEFVIFRVGQFTATSNSN